MRQFLPFAHTGREIIPATDLLVPQSGKGVFTTIKVVDSIPLFLEKHLQRLTQNAEQVGVTVKLSEFPNNIQDLLRANKTTDAAVRISVLEDAVLIHATTLPQTGEEVTAVISESSELPTIKQLDRTIYTKAEEYTESKRADTVLFVQNSCFVESPISNIISLNADGSLVTPPLVTQGLKGIMRQVLLEKGILKEKEIPVTAETPLILINSLRVQAVTQLDGKKLPDSLDLLQRIQAYIKEEEKSYEHSYHR